ncbi:type 2 lantipeptide synthetase LanM [Tolypothrix sp. PCC 7910]|uniref:type 2 lanthipeptide synthetase LanM family protein n=1 Tax=Tolypothrix sp. PCC 7910 TaxID=2099387 RepID=UPI0014278FBE|nr:type 2 lanthipeptide synthetase LanM family protein [Tolypothrix sp. PCC 7910]QIR35414.1 type 2 lantipeptide synthetase LanM [Tolypothrix sp. PCC 7910]
MKISDSKISQIVINATFLSENFNTKDYHNINSQQLDQNLIEKRLQNWCQAIGGEEKLKQRLHWDGLDFNIVRSLLVTAGFGKDDKLPAWAETLKELVESGISLLNLEVAEKLPLDSQKPLPFEDFYFPFILVARRKLSAALSLNHDLVLLSTEAYLTLEYGLLQQLVSLGTETLLFEFDKLRSNQASAKQDNHTEESKNRILYDQFIQNILEDGGLKFFEDYPVLARLIATNINFWVTNTTEFIQRLQADITEIEQTFSEDTNLGKVKEIETSLSNRHHGGRSILAITFDSGIKIVYKPKDLSLDVAFNNLLDWCNQQRISLPFKITKILQRQEYAWVEFIAHQPCENQTAVNNFYKRAGMLLSLLFVLGAKDCGSENVIANSEYSILIDADILMQPIVKSNDESEDWFQDSVLKAGFLPAWEGNTFSANAQDSSVLGNIYPQQVNASREWQFINTDGMHLTSKTAIIPSGTNAVILEGKSVSPRNYVEEIVTGFEEIYRLLIKNKETLLGQYSPLSTTKSLKSRFIPHPSILYVIVAKNSLNPQSLRNGIEYSILINSLIDTFSRSLLEVEANPENWAIWQAETRFLQQQDIPYFSVSCNSSDLEIERDKLIKQFFKISSYQSLITQLQNLDEQNLALQIKLIRMSFDAKFAHLTLKDTALQGNSPQFHSLTNEELLQEAVKIGNSLVSNGICNSNGCNWINLGYMFQANRYQLQPLDDSLYRGRAGVSLFLAALAKITGKHEFKEVALIALLPLQQSLKKSEIRQKILESEFGLLGIGGFIYSLVKISQFLEDPSLLESAQLAAKLLTKEVIATDEKFDIMWGVAGAIPGLLTLYDQTGEPTVLDIAVTCGNHLLSQRSNSKPRAWVTIESKKPLTGFSHGAAAISLSLLRLYAATADIAFLEAAKEAIEYEKSVFDESVQNWPDFRLSEKTNQINFLHAWCHGSAGIGLARLGSLSIIQTEEIYSDINIALETTQKYGTPSTDTDHLCCGHMGRVELFILASQKLGNQEWLNTAIKQAAWVIERAKANGEYSFSSHYYQSAYSSNFFRGKAGVGYQLLRLAFPESLPSVLIGE